jgi:WD40 repeat protein/tRNA A-37 threonylcarbamoyl transferase component Bud32
VSDTTPSSPENLRGEAIASYYRLREQKLPFDREAFLARYPELYADLASFVDGVKDIEEIAHPTPGPDATPEHTSHPGTGSWPPAPDAYELLNELGRGGMGVVYKARQKSLGRVVALKMVLSGSHASKIELARLRSEAEAIARLSHPHIVQIHEIGEHDGLPFLCLEYLSGGTLASRLAGTPMPPRQAAEMVTVLAGAVHAAHRAGIIHRDLKPSNVLFAADGTPKVTDFGLAKQRDSGLTASDAVLGTPSYMAPEQAEGRVREIGPAADVYSLGAILYECLTGRPPFKSSSDLETIRQVIHDDPAPPRRLNRAVPRDLETVCLNCLRKQPQRRYATAAELADDLGRFLDGKPITARPAGRFERAWKWVKRYPARAALLSLFIFVLGGTAYFLHQRSLLHTQTIAREEAEKREVAEMRARAQAELAQAREKHLLYFHRILLAHSEWRDNHVGRMLELLNVCPEELRNWEWRYLKRLCYADLLTLRGHTDGVRGVSFSPDGKRLASASDDGTIRVWDATTGQQLLTLKGHGDKTTCVAFNFDGQYLASAGWDETVRIWNVVTGREVHTFRGHVGHVYGVAFTPDGRRLASGGGDRTVRIWDISDGREVLTLKDHTDMVTSVVFSPDGRRLASASSDRTVKVWDLSATPSPRTFRGHDGEVWGVAFSPDGSRLASASWDRTVKVWDVERGTEVVALKGHTGFVVSVAFSAHGQRLVSGSVDTTVRIWDMATGEEMLCCRGHTGEVRGIASTPDAERLASASRDGTVKIWDASRGAPEARTLRGHAGETWGVAFSPDGRRLASASHDNTVKVWDSQNGEGIRGLGLGLSPECPTPGFLQRRWNDKGLGVGDGARNPFLPRPHG